MKRIPVVLSVLCALALIACSSGKKKLELGGTCSLNSDCADGLQCKFGACHKACMKSVDCATGERCVQVDGIAVCQMVKEQACGVAGAPAICALPLACGQDKICRNTCSPTIYCLGGQVCTAGFCMEIAEADAGAAGSPDGGAGTAGTDTAVASNPDLGPAGTPDVAADAPVPAQDAPAVIDAPQNVDALSGSSDTRPTADTRVVSTTDTAPINGCAACTPGQECVNGTCQACGRSAGQPCCAGVCNANLSCNESKVCVCGDVDQACCEGSKCTTGLACEGGTCKCGGFGSACCAGNTCNAGGVCAGLRCGCVQSCEDGFYWKTDGTFHGPFTLLNTDGSARSKAKSLGVGTQLGDACIVADDGTVWCQGSNSNGQLGSGDITAPSSTKLVQVLSAPAPSGAPLAGIKKVSSGDRYVCALASEGSVFCWGMGTSGQLGTGNSLNSSYAVPVLDSPGGSRLTGATDLAVAHNHACVLKQDGSVWCWGTNTVGQLGNGSTSPSGSPVKVTGLLNPAISLSVGNQYQGMEYSETCVIDSQRSVWCWGFMAGPDGAGNANINRLPIRLVMTKNGAALTDAVQVDAENSYVRRSDGSLWYIGRTDTTPPVTENNIPVSGAYWLGKGCWIGSDGKPRGINGTVTCP